MKERGRYQIQYMKTRSSSGVGQKTDLEFNVETLRINDLGEEEESSFNQQKIQTTTSLIQNLKRTSSVSTATDLADKDGVLSPSAVKQLDHIPKIKGSKTVGDIRNILANLNSEQD
jgi:hypothetical protein